MMLFPAFSKLDAKKDKDTMQNVYQFSVKYGALFVTPVAALVMCLAEPAVSTLFGQSYMSAPLFLALLSLTYFFPAFGSLSVGNFLSSQGKTTFILYLTLVAVAIGLPLGYAFIMLFGVLGLIVTSLVTGIVTTIIPVVWVRKKLRVDCGFGFFSKDCSVFFGCCRCYFSACFGVGFLQRHTIRYRCSVLCIGFCRCNFVN